jgi:hypothetical protein
MSQDAHDLPKCCPFCHVLKQLSDSGAATHLRNARKEVLLAAKALIEAKLEQLEHHDKPGSQAQKIEIQ